MQSPAATIDSTVRSSPPGSSTIPPRRAVRRVVPLAVLATLLACGCHATGPFRLAGHSDDAVPPQVALGQPTDAPPAEIARALVADGKPAVVTSAEPVLAMPGHATDAHFGGSRSRADAEASPPGVVRLTAHTVDDSDPQPVHTPSTGVANDQPGWPIAPAAKHAHPHHEASAADASSSVVASAVRFAPAEPRFPVEQAGGAASASFAATSNTPAADPTTPAEQTSAASGTNAQAVTHPDEYLLDGGDRGQPVHYDTFSRYGLETEDTVAEFSDEAGRRHVLPTNRVAIYAPRFGAVQTVSGIGSDTQVEKLAYTRDRRRSSAVGARSVLDTSQQNAKVVAARMRSRASGLEGASAGRTMHQALAVVRHVKLLNAFQDVAFLQTGRVDQADQPRLAYGLKAALQWSRDEFPVIAAQTASLHEVTARFRPAEIVGRSLEHLKKGRLRIVKLADKRVARPGDVITFTIRFDNLGDRPLYHIRIVDNLTPRLEFIEDSAQADLPGSLTIEDNEEGSVVLTFELEKPLPGHSGGVITFQARLR